MVVSVQKTEMPPQNAMRLTKMIVHTSFLITEHDSNFSGNTSLVSNASTLLILQWNALTAFVPTRPAANDFTIPVELHSAGITNTRIQTMKMSHIMNIQQNHCPTKLSFATGCKAFRAIFLRKGAKTNESLKKGPFY